MRLPTHSCFLYENTNARKNIAMSRAITSAISSVSETPAPLPELKQAGPVSDKHTRSNTEASSIPRLSIRPGTSPRQPRIKLLKSGVDPATLSFTTYQFPGFEAAPPSSEKNPGSVAISEPFPLQRKLTNRQLGDILSTWQSTGTMNCEQISEYLTLSGKNWCEKIQPLAEYYRFMAEVLRNTASGSAHLPDQLLGHLIDQTFECYAKTANQFAYLRQLKNRGRDQVEHSLLKEAKFAFLALIHRHPLMLRHFEEKEPGCQREILAKSKIKTVFRCLQWLDQNSIILNDAELVALGDYHGHGLIKPEQIWQSIRRAPAAKPTDNADRQISESRAPAVGHGMKTARPEELAQGDLPESKWPRHEHGDEFDPAAEYWLPHTAPGFTALRPSEPDWMEAQSRYLNEVLWQDD